MFLFRLNLWGTKEVKISDSNICLRGKTWTIFCCYFTKLKICRVVATVTSHLCLLLSCIMHVNIRCLLRRYTTVINMRGQVQIPSSDIIHLFPDPISLCCSCGLDASGIQSPVSRNLEQIKTSLVPTHSVRKTPLNQGFNDTYLCKVYMKSMLWPALNKFCRSLIRTFKQTSGWFQCGVPMCMITDTHTRLVNRWLEVCFVCVSVFVNMSETNCNDLEKIELWEIRWGFYSTDVYICC